MPNILAELKARIEDNGLTMDNIKCAGLWLHQGYDMDTYEDKGVDFKIYMYNGSKPALYDDYREAVISDMGKYEYDSGYGGQELFGTVWMDNGEWLTRGEYDGSEWWEHHRRPSIPEYLETT